MSKIIKAVFTGRFCTTRRVFQYDTDDKLQIVNLDLPQSYTVDFSNSLTGQSVPVLATSDTVQIPPEMFVPGSEIYAWVWVSDTNGGYTKCQATIPIDPRAQRTGTEPTPAQASAWDEAVDTLNETVDGIPTAIDTALAEAKASGVFDGEDGADGNIIWWTTDHVTASGDNAGIQRRKLHGPDGMTPAVGDYVFGPAAGTEGEPTTLYVIIAASAAIIMTALGSIVGPAGYSPEVTITSITGGHRVTITDEDHPDGQSFDVMDGQGGSGTVDDDFSTTSENPVQNKVITVAFNQAAQQLTNLGLALDDKVDKLSGKGLSTNDFTDSDKDKLDGAASETWVQQQGYITGADLALYRTEAQQDTIDDAQDAAIAAKYTKPSGGIPKTDLASAVQTSLGKADTALQSAPVTSVNGQTGAVTLSIPSAASDVGAVASNQGVANANKVLTVNSSGVVAPEDDRFVVTFTPTSPDYSGTMDRTPADLADAYDAGKRIIAYAPAFNFRCELSLTTIKSGGLYTFDFIALGELNGQDIMLRLLTSDSTSTFTTKIYPLATGQWTGGSY